MFVSIMAFFAKISDPLLGGTYMTLLNTVTNLGGNWPTTLALWFVDPLTQKDCVGSTVQLENYCRNKTEQEVSFSHINMLSITADTSDCCKTSRQGSSRHWCLLHIFRLQAVQIQTSALIKKYVSAVALRNVF